MPKKTKELLKKDVNRSKPKKPSFKKPLNMRLSVKQ